MDAQPGSRPAAADRRFRRPERGFTLIELLIVVIVIGALAAIAIPRFFGTKEKAFVAAMRSDLRNLTTAQSAYFSENLVYAPALSDLTGIFAPSQSVSIAIDSATSTGWGGTATHPGTAVVCEVSVSRLQANSPSCQ